MSIAAINGAYSRDKKSMDDATRKSVVEHLTQFVSKKRLVRMNQVLSMRTNFITVVLEDIHKPHNASAVIRSCECFGIQKLHIIENTSQYEVNNSVTQGASDWVDIARYKNGEFNTPACYQALRDTGFCLVATTLRDYDCDISDLIPDRPLAVVFGDEESGLSDYAIDNADVRTIIPMYGFTQSFNLSVSAAIVLHNLIPKLHSMDVDWRLAEAELLDLRYRWLKSAVSQSEVIERRFLNHKGN
jgi:tRNA (guanosine-2'-O-)-methyltransferase